MNISLNCSTRMKTLFIQACFLSLLLAAAPDDWSDKLNKSRVGVEQIKTFMNVVNKGGPYARLSLVTDTFGPRLAGSDGLEKAIDFLKIYSKNISLDVTEEKVMVTSWQEVSSSAMFHSKIRNKSLAIVAYGPSVSGNFTAPVLLVKSFKELDEKASEAIGKIVVYNPERQDYWTCVQYRNDGASRAAERGAVASLTRSIASFSIYSTHTGPVMYKGNKTIPAAAITIEDAAFIERILERDPNATIDLHINTVTGEDRESRNLIIDIPGTDLKNEIILAGTHTDSWHVDDGVFNNAISCNVLYEAMRAIKKLELQPRRTLRLALWTAGEQDSKGEKQYFAEQEKNKEQIKLIMRPERGMYNILGLIISNGEKLHALVQAILDEFFKEWKLITLRNLMTSPSTSKWVDDAKIPKFEFLTNMRRYLTVYNSGGDTLDKLTSEDLDKAATLWTSILYTLGTMDIDF